MYVYLPTVQILSGLSRFLTFKMAKSLDTQIFEILYAQIFEILCEKMRFWKISTDSSQCILKGEKNCNLQCINFK